MTDKKEEPQTSKQDFYMKLRNLNEEAQQQGLGLKDRMYVMVVALAALSRASGIGPDDIAALMKKLLASGPIGIPKDN